MHSIPTGFSQNQRNDPTRTHFDRHMPQKEAINPIPLYFIRFSRQQKLYSESCIKTTGAAIKDSNWLFAALLVLVQKKDRAWKTNEVHRAFNKDNNQGQTPNSTHDNSLLDEDITVAGNWTCHEHPILFSVFPFHFFNIWNYITN